MAKKKKGVFVRLKLRDEAYQLVLEEKKKYELRSITIGKDTIVNNLLIDEYRRRHPLKQDNI